MKSLLYLLDPPLKDSIEERINRESSVQKQWFYLGISILFLSVSIFILFISLLKKRDIPAETFTVDYKNNTIQNTVTLPFPHQNFKNISGWVFEAIMSSYSFNFRNIGKQIDNTSYYFTAEGYKTYLQALKTSKIEERVVGDKLEISTIPLQDPVLIKGGAFGTTDYWRYRVPVLVSYYGGRTPVFERQMVEVLVLRVPSYDNPKGLSIAEFNMVPM